MDAKALPSASETLPPESSALPPAEGALPPTDGALPPADGALPLAEGASPLPKRASPDATTAEFAVALCAWFAERRPCVVAFSGGVDSALIAAAAHKALGDQALAVTGVSDSLAQTELKGARETAWAIGIRHVELPTREFTRPEYLANTPRRCFHCKTELYERIRHFLSGFWPSATLVNGANLDDLGDFRPGMAAADNFSVKSPLIELGINKENVRRLAQFWNLALWDKPASPCLASRIAYGEKVSPEKLAMVEAAEDWFRAQGFRVVRVRFHSEDLARIEVPRDELNRFADSDLRARAATKLKELGFKFVTLDLFGFQSGSLNILAALH